MNWAILISWSQIETRSVLHFLLEQFAENVQLYFSFPFHFWSPRIWQAAPCVYFIGFHYSRNNSLPPTSKKGEGKYLVYSVSETYKAIAWLWNSSLQHKISGNILAGLVRAPLKQLLRIYHHNLYDWKFERPFRFLMHWSQCTAGVFTTDWIA